MESNPHEIISDSQEQSDRINKLKKDQSGK